MNHIFHFDMHVYLFGTFFCWISLTVSLSQLLLLGLCPSVPYWIYLVTPYQFHLESLRLDKVLDHTG